MRGKLKSFEEMMKDYWGRKERNEKKKAERDAHIKERGVVRQKQEELLAEKLRKEAVEESRKEKLSAVYRKKREDLIASGDDVGIFFIYLMKNGMKVSGDDEIEITKSRKSSIFKAFADMIAKNHSEVKYPKKVEWIDGTPHPLKYELLIVKEVHGNTKPTLLRGEGGKFEKNMFVNTDRFEILHKDDWYVEDLFSVYGFDFEKEKKDITFIIDNIILRDPSYQSRVFITDNKLISHYDDDFDMVICNDKREALLLYNALDRMIDHKKYPNVFFMGRASGIFYDWMIEEILKKTGWTKERYDTI